MGVNVIEVDLNLKYVLITDSLNLHFAKAQCSPFLFQTTMPLNYFPAYCTHVGSTLTVGCSSGNIVLLCVLAYRAVG
jgi:hypothetical protein